MKHKPTTVEREARVTQRATLRAAAAEKVGALREWREARAQAALEKSREAAAARNALPRGVDRVPERLRGLAVTVEPYTVGKHGTVLDQPEDFDPAGNYRQRRLRGERGKPRRLRRREMPGAEARRIERNRKAWSA